MPRHDADRNLLFGILALQMDLISRDALIAAMGTWAVQKHRPIGEILVEAGALDPTDRSNLEPMIDRRIARHGGNTAVSLAAISSVATIASDLNRSIADAEMRESLSQIPANTRSDPYATQAPFSRESPRAGVRYQKVRDHAHGGLGVVFVARDAELNREVALKEIQDRHADDRASRARFLLEAEITGGLEHPGIVPVYGLGAYDDGRPFYAMRFIRGDSLKDAIAGFHADESLKNDPGRRTLELQKLLRRFLDVCNAVEYAHSRGVLHRDLKPDNVMVGKYGETLVVDWGLAKSVDRPEGDWPETQLTPSSASGSAETLPGSVIGTPAYMSPEQAEGRIDLLGPTSDVYSLGATLYALLTGHPPFVEKDMGKIIRLVSTGQFPRPREVSPWLDPAIEGVCLKAMALNPNGRYASPRTLAEDVERWIADEPVTAFQDSLGTRFRRWAVRHRTLVAVAASLLVTTSIALGIATLAINAQRSIVSEKSRQIEIAYREKTVAFDQAKAAEERAKEESAKVLGVIDVLVKTFRVSDPVNLEGFGLRAGADSGKTLNAGDILDRSANLVRTTLNEQPLVQATLMDSIGDVYRSMAEFEKAEPLLQAARTIREKKLATDDPDLSTTLIHLGWLHQEKGQFDEADRLYRLALERRTRRFGELSPEALDAKFHIASLSMFEDDLEKAEPAFREIIDKLGRIRGEDHRDVAIARLSLAATLFSAQRVERYVEAIQLSNRAMKVLLTTKEAEQIFEVVQKFNKGFVLQGMKLYRPAEKTFREGLEVARGLFGVNHPYLTFFLFEIGNNKELQGDLASAEASYREALDLGRRTVGLAHPKAIKGVNALSNLLVRTGRHEEAKKLCQELIAARRQAYGRDHVWVADALVSASFITDLHGDFEESVSLLREALGIYRIHRNRFPMNFVSCLNNLAVRLTGDGTLPEAEQLLREVLPVARVQYGAKERTFAIVLKNLAFTLCAQGLDGEESDRLRADALAILRSPFDPVPGVGLDALMEQALSEYRRGRLDRAEKLARQVIDESSRISSQKPAKQALYRKELAGILIAKGDLKPGILALQEAIAILRKADPSESKDLPHLLSLLALARQEEGDLSGSRQLLNELLANASSIADPIRLNQTTAALARFRDTPAQADQLERLARSLLALKPMTESNKINGATALLRAGRIDEATQLLEELRRIRNGDFVYADIYLAIAYQKLGRLEAAQNARKRAIAWIDKPEKLVRKWDIQFELKTLRQELDDLFRDPNADLPADVFAR